jgi:copper chaperone CopZ
MRYLLTGFTVAALAAISGCQSSAPVAHRPDGARTAQETTSASAAPDTAVLTVHGMGCPQCANNVDAQLMKVSGVESVTIDMGSGKVLAKLSPDKRPTRDQLAKAIDQTGFTLVKIDMPQ